MAGLLKRFGFAGVVAAVMVAAVAAVAIKTALEPAAPAAAGPQASAKAAAKAPPGGGRPGGPPGGGGGGGEAVGVLVETIKSEPFYDVVQALGTAQAKESVTITSKITDTILQIRFDSGDVVRRGQTLVVLASVEQQADLAEAKAQLEASKRDYERYAELGERGFAPVSRVEEARAAFDRAQARVSALEARIAERIIRAPFSGVIGLRTASPGALARPGEAIATLDDVSTIKLDFDVPESQIAQVRPGAEIEAIAAAAPGQVFRGAVADLDTRLNPQSRTLRARALLANPQGVLKPGMLLTVNVRYNPRDALSVPEIALLERSDGLFVFKVAAQGERQVASLAPVRVGRRVGGRAEILSGVAAGDLVVVEGVQRVRAGQGVRAIAPGASPAAAPPAAKASPPSPNAAPSAAPTAAPNAPPAAAPVKTGALAAPVLSAGR